MTARVDRDPERAPGAPPGYRPVRGPLGSCDRCGAAVSADDTQAQQAHERFHQALRAMWATAQSSSPPSPNDQEASPMEADRSRAGGHNHSTTQPERAAPPPRGGASTPPSPSPPGLGGPNRPASGSAKGAHADTSARGRQAKPRETHGTAAGRTSTTEQGDPRRFAR